VVHLRTLGALELRTSGGSSALILLAQPRSTALLVYLLLARPGSYLRRDTLCALFWPESDDERARGALSQALTRIRRAAGSEVLEVRGKSEIRIAPGSVACDVLALEEAVAAGDHGRALELYGGPFLAGFHVASAPGFEAWAEAERDRLRTLAADAARSLALDQMANGRLTDAGRSAGRALALAPESEAAATELVRGMWTAGDRAGAVGLYESWAATLARELELEPSPGLHALAVELREAVAPRADGVVSGRGAGPDPVPPPGRAGRSTEQAPSPLTVEAAEPRGSLRRRAATATSAGLALLLGGWLAVQVGILSAGYPVETGGRGLVGFAPRDWLVVADFEGPSSEPGLALAFETLLIRDLEAAGYTSVVGGVGALSRRGLEDVLARMRLPPDVRIDADLACQIAEREGAAGVLAGRVIPLGGDYVLTASILGAAGCQELIRASTSAPFDQLSPAVAAVSAELRARLGESRSSIRSSPPLPPITAGMTEALHLVSHYVASADLWDDEERGAATLLAAIRMEPDFSFAHFLLALHYQRLGRYGQAVPHVVQAYENRAQLTRPGRLGMEAIYQRYIASNPAAAMRVVETIMADLPGSEDATMPFLADVAIWVGDWQRALAVSMDYLRREPVGLGAHLAFTRAEAAAWAVGRVGLADTLHQALLRKTAEAGMVPDRTAQLLHRLRHRDWSGAEALCAEHPGWDRCAYLHLARGRLALAAAALEPLLADHNDRRQPWDRPAAVAALAELERLRGRPDSAWSILRGADLALPKEGPARAGMHLSRFLLCASAAELGRSREMPECAIEQEDPSDWDRDPSFTVVLRSGAWSRRLLAVRSLERGEPAVALAQARAAVRSNFGNPAAVDHLLQARAFDALGRPDSALVHYHQALRIERDPGFPTSAGILLPLAPVHRRIGEMAEEAGDTSTAARQYRAFLDLWAEADAELQPEVDRVRRRVARIARGARGG
jgi:DNA-binding SARP family transcriptional activator